MLVQIYNVGFKGFLCISRQLKNYISIETKDFSFDTYISFKLTGFIFI